MNEHQERKPSDEMEAGDKSSASVPESAQPAGLAEALKDVMRQMAGIEKKLDALLEKSVRPPARKPYTASDSGVPSGERSFNRESGSPSRERSFKRDSGTPSRERSFRRDSGSPSRERSFRRDSRPPRRNEDRPRESRPFEPREPRPPEVGVFIRRNVHGEHFKKKFDRENPV